MNGFRINSYETKVYGGATKKEIFSNIQTSFKSKNSGQKLILIIEDFVSNNRIYIFMSSSVPPLYGMNMVCF